MLLPIITIQFSLSSNMRGGRRKESVRPGDKNKIENICVTAIFCPTGNFSKFPKLCLVSVCLGVPLVSHWNKSWNNKRKPRVC